MSRSYSVTLRGNPVRIEGNEVQVGQTAPDFTVMRPPFTPVSLSSQQGKVVVLSVTPSIDTPVCDTQLRTLNKKAAELSEDIVVWNLSTDLPFALKRFCGAAGIERAEALSDARDRDFAMKYGVYMADMGMLARSMWIIGRDGKVAYREIVPEMATEPNYDAAIEALKKVVG